MDNSEGMPISKLTSIKRLAAAYRSMYEPKEETETETEEDENDNSST